ASNDWRHVGEAWRAVGRGDGNRVGVGQFDRGTLGRPGRDEINIRGVEEVFGVEVDVLGKAAGGNRGRKKAGEVNGVIGGAHQGDRRNRILRGIRVGPHDHIDGGRTRRCATGGSSVRGES